MVFIKIYELVFVLGWRFFGALKSNATRYCSIVFFFAILDSDNRSKYVSYFYVKLEIQVQTSKC